MCFAAADYTKHLLEQRLSHLQYCVLAHHSETSKCSTCLTQASMRHTKFMCI